MPRIYVIGGPNGAEKTTASMALFPHGLQCPEYVNADAIAAGGHHIPEDVVRRRYVRGIQNFVSLYVPLAEEWACYDNSHGEKLPIASKAKDGTITVEDQEKWNILHKHGQ